MEFILLRARPADPLLKGVNAGTGIIVIVDLSSPQSELIAKRIECNGYWMDYFDSQT